MTKVAVPRIVGPILYRSTETETRPPLPGESSCWKVHKLIVKPGDTVVWKSPASEIVVTFPSAHTPLEGSATEASGRSPLRAKISDGATPGYYPYSISVKDVNNQPHAVCGNSPPEMIVE